MTVSLKGTGSRDRIKYFDENGLDKNKVFKLLWWVCDKPLQLHLRRGKGVWDIWNFLRCPQSWHLMHALPRPFLNFPDVWWTLSIRIAQAQTWFLFCRVCAAKWDIVFSNVANFLCWSVASVLKHCNNRQQTFKKVYIYKDKEEGPW